MHVLFLFSGSSVLPYVRLKGFWDWIFNNCRQFLLGFSYTRYVKSVTVILKIPQTDDLHLQKFFKNLKMEHFMATIRVDYQVYFLLNEIGTNLLA